MTAPGRVEHLHVRRHNLSLVLRLLAGDGPRSRARIATATGLTRATVSSLTAELIELGLVREVGLDAGHRLGRPGTLLAVDGSEVVTIGAELNVGYVAVLVRDLGGRTVHERRLVTGSNEASDPGQVVEGLAGELRAAIAAARDDGRRVSGVTVAVPGVVDGERGVVRLAPNLGWHDVDLLTRLAPVVGPGVALALDNEANLGALAEYRAGALAGTRHLVYVLAESGIGGGLIVDGSLLRGASGAAGEIGHMTVVADGGERCGCGSIGCWETVVGIPALVRRTLGAAVPPDHLLPDPEQSVAEVLAAARAGEPSVLAALHDVGVWIGIGLANLIDLFDPEAVVLAGYLHDLAPWLLPVAVETAAEHSVLGTLDRCRIEVSTLGFSAAALGGAIHAAERLFTDPALVAP